MKKILTIAIPTYYGGKDLVKTVKSLFKQNAKFGYDVVVCIDGNPLDPKIESAIKKAGAIVVFSKQRGGQVARMKQVLSMAKTPYIMFGQDDVLYTNNVLSEVVRTLENNKKVTMTACTVLPYKPTSLLEKSLAVGMEIAENVANRWLGGDNYLNQSGRCLVFKTNFVKKFKISEDVISSDAYLYFLNKINGGHFLYSPKGIAYIRLPSKLNEHLKQSQKYQVISQETHNYLDLNLDELQPLPKFDFMVEFVKYLIKKPVLTLIYICVLIYTRAQRNNPFIRTKKFWDTDLSTKSL